MVFYIAAWALSILTLIITAIMICILINEFATRNSSWDEERRLFYTLIGVILLSLITMQLLVTFGG